MSEYRLPYPQSWWIQPSRIIGGCYPGDLDIDRAEGKLNSLIEVGVRTIICLQQEKEMDSCGLPFYPYIHRLRKIAESKGITIDWHRFPIKDQHVPTPLQMKQILDMIDYSVKNNPLVYVHCWGGHGRTGTVAACWLIEQGMSYTEAFKEIKRQRQHDPILLYEPSPQTEVQYDFARQWLNLKKRLK